DRSRITTHAYRLLLSSRRPDCRDFLPPDGRGGLRRLHQNQTRRFFGGRQPLCGIGVTSRIERICNPALASAWIADSRPLPGPCTRTWTRFIPRLTASRATCSAATVAANGVDFFEPLKPAFPALPHTTTFPARSVMVTSVLLNVALMCATPSASTCFRVRFGREPFFGFAIPAPCLVRASVPPAVPHTTALAWTTIPRLLLRRLLLPRNRPPRTLVRPRVRVRPLPPHRQPTAMPQTPVAADVHQPLDVHRDLGTKRALHLVLVLDDPTQPVHLVIRQLVHPTRRLRSEERRVGKERRSP